DSNIRDLVCHSGAAISSNNAPDGAWQFYLHPHQVDNLLAISGARTFYLVNFSWEFPLQIVRLEGIRDLKTTTDREFRVYNSSRIPRLRRLLATSTAARCSNFFLCSLPFWKRVGVTSPDFSDLPVTYN
ncbi:MAG: hypothetical protein CV045_03115, partial [Cyanobacteria bacterium M5B4]